MTRFFLAAVLCSSLLAIGCGDDDRGPGGSGSDSGTVRRDSGLITFMDSGTPPGMDSGPPPGVDSGPRPGVDSGPRRDSGGPPPMGDGTIGSACMGAGDCTEGMMPSCQTSLMGFITFPGGYCTSSCSATAACPAGAECVMFGGSGFCAKNCMSNADCRESEGYTCGTPPVMTMGMLCLPPGL